MVVQKRKPGRVSAFAYSYRVAKTFSKKKAYGHYCNLCRKFGFPILSLRHFDKPLIMAMERANMKKLQDERNAELAQRASNPLANAYST